MNVSVKYVKEYFNQYLCHGVKKMKIIFEIPANYTDVIDDIVNKCDDSYLLKEKENLSGDQIIAIVAIVTPVVWELVEKYLSDKMVTIQIELNEETIVTISERTINRALMKAKKIRAEWEKTNK